MKPPSTALCVFVFLVALCINIGLGPTLGKKSKEASAAPVALGGLNPSLWAFSIWAILYTAFAIGYIMWIREGSSPLPWAFVAVWVLNITWLCASCANQWTLAMGLIVLYVAAAVAALPGLRAGAGGSSNALGVLNVATASMVVWLVAASLLNLQILKPKYAGGVRSAALPLLFLVALFLVYKNASLSDYPGCFTVAIAATVVWICLALDDSAYYTMVTRLYKQKTLIFESVRENVDTLKSMLHL